MGYRKLTQRGLEGLLDCAWAGLVRFMGVKLRLESGRFLSRFFRFWALSFPGSQPRTRFGNLA
jgi:hypothetical protein